MCSASMIMDHYCDKWTKTLREIQDAGLQYPLPEPPITQNEIREFRALLARAREWDKAHGQSNCELEEKREKVRKLAEQLGVKIEILDEALT